jgi:transitional endoplasmic reticulum ATPase
MCTGYVGADLAAVCREAVLRALRRATHSYAPQFFTYFFIFFSFYYFLFYIVLIFYYFRVADQYVMQQDFVDAIKVLPPSTLKGSLVDDIPKTTWQDIGGLEEVKQVLKNFN